MNRIIMSIDIGDLIVMNAMIVIINNLIMIMNMNITIITNIIIVIHNNIITVIVVIHIHIVPQSEFPSMGPQRIL